MFYSIKELVEQARLGLLSEMLQNHNDCYRV